MTMTVNPSDAGTRSALSYLAGLLLAFACAGCGGSSGSPQGQSASPQQPGTSSPSDAPPSQDTQQTPGLPKAADGTKVRACYDGNCEIMVTKRVRIPLHPRFGFKTFSFDPDDSTWRYSYLEGGGGELRFLEPPYKGSWAAPSGKQSIDMAVVASEDSKAVISLRPGK